MTYRDSTLERAFTSFTGGAASLAGKSRTFVVACTLIIVWAATGPYFHYSDTWQLVINTSTTIVTFLMCFLIQASANRDAIAIQTKLDELLDAESKDHKKMIGIERMTLTELEAIREEIEKRVRKYA